MATVKISDLPEIPHLNFDTTQSIIPVVDLTTDETGKVTVRTLAEGLFHNDALKVGEEDILFPNVIAQFVGESEVYLQVNLQNLTDSGSADYVATADIGTNANNYVDLGINNSTYNDPDYSATKALDGYLYVSGSLDSSSDGNLVIGTASAGANISFVAGGTTEANVIAKITKFGITLNNSSRLEFTDGSIQTVAAAPASLSQGAYNTANSASSNTIIIQGVNLTQNTNITAVNQYAQSGFATANDANGMAIGAFNKANNALANTSGTFAGNLTITGNVLTQGTISLNNSSFATDTAFVKITSSDGFVTQSPSNTNYMLHVTGKANSVTRVVLDSFGANTYPLVAGRMGRGSAAAPAAVANNDVMFRVVGNGWTGTQFPPSSPTKIDFVAAENFSDTNRGTRIEFWNTPTGSNTIQRIADFNAESAEFLGTVNPTKGFIFTPRLPVGNQTAITIDFSSDVIIKANLAADLTFTLTNFVYGKVVEVWLTNTSGSTRTVTHGCSAINSSENSTTFSMASTSSAYLKYFSIDGDLANTFVAVQSA
jgi:hypothetical protein